MTDLMWHAIVMAIIASVPVKLNWKAVIIILAIPFIGEFAQFFMDSRTPDRYDLQVGVCAAGAVLCLRRLYGEIAPVVRRYRRRKRRLGL